MIRARVADIRFERRFAAPLTIGGAVDNLNLGTDVELRIRLYDDGAGVGVDSRAIELVEESIEHALNGTVATRLVPIEAALPPGPRRIVL
jgi:hypothetical protein